MITARKTAKEQAFSMAEMIMAMFLVSLLAAVAMIGFSGFAGDYKFNNASDQIVTMFAISATSASQTDRRYGILFDFIDDSYTLYEINTENPYSEDFDNLLEEDVIDRGYFSEHCQLLYIQFDDGEMIDGSQQGRTLFVAGRAGWDYGGIVALSDYEGNIYSIVVKRFSKKPDVLAGEAALPEPIFNMSF